MAPYVGIEQWTEEEKKTMQAIDPDRPRTPGLDLMEKYFPFTRELRRGEEFSFEEFQKDFPGLDVSTYEAFGEQYPFGGIPVYDPFGEPYPRLELPRYEEFGRAYPELGGLYGEAEDVITRMLRGEEAGLPVEELMEAYTAEERRALAEQMPEIRESWAERGLLRSGMAREAEREAVEESAERRATKRAGLMKEDVILRRQGTVTGLGLAMQHIGVGYGAQKDAYQAANNEYTKVYQSSLQAGMSEGEANERGWAAANMEYVRQFTSVVDASKFMQGIKERAYEASRDEYSKVYRSQLEVGLSEFDAQTKAWDAARSEYARIQQMEFQKKMFELEAKLRRDLAAQGIDAQTTQSIWSSIGGILGSIIGGPIGGAIGAGIGGLFGGGGTQGGLTGTSTPF